VSEKRILRRIPEPSREKVEKIARCGDSSGRMSWATYNMHGEMRNTIREKIKILAKGGIGHCEWKHHKPWFDEECLKLLDLRKQVGCKGCSIYILSYPNANLNLPVAHPVSGDQVMVE
jgi:hypothetical protein